MNRLFYKKCPFLKIDAALLLVIYLHFLQLAYRDSLHRGRVARQAVSIEQCGLRFIVQCGLRIYSVVWAVRVQ